MAVGTVIQPNKPASIEDLRQRVESLPSLDNLVPDFIREHRVGILIALALYHAVVIFAYVPPISLFVGLSDAAWGVISAVCGVLGTLVTTWLVKRYDARVAIRAQTVQTSQELLRQTIEWAAKERQELYLESERSYKAMIEMREQEIVELRAEIQRLKQPPNTPPRRRGK